ncbi:hypothetical protein AA23498_0338 [Acetobacter nitrogenifigens DSM 23921 = NBRC 105050]|uniref:Sporulation protein n=1 Tax=Acetobacter nitrogenifigens DSM 23921 = NBRC 105050 TaxID=1120919 RepID=A0A511XAU9_9PROT|nr:SPOR domain-containing protein [Acetobacter nitrogenifigens]GBQ88280.1 hypothetical protein AA23498_0338 [Acetobacter nitrogenifigens DSM 23921 = NBRC 105050]GEN60093.1 sporulation protein [Acetobacter nitrogenifigens DSM 23921 = NBRC 105050]
MTDRDDTPPDPHEDRLNRARERMATDYEDAPPPRRSGGKLALGALLAGDANTRRLTYGVAGLGGLLVLGIGGWSLLGHHQGGIPVLGPPPGPVREKPADPGGMQLDGVMAPAETPEGATHLAPGPEQPDPAALAARYGGKAAASEEPPAAAPAPASAPDAASAPAKDTPSQAAPKATDASPSPTPAAPPSTVTAKPLPDTATTQTSHADQADAPPVQSKAPPEETAKPVASGPYGVQLAALDSEANARKEWDRARATAPDLFAGHTPEIEKVTNKTAIFFRLRMRGFDSMAAAQSFCEKLRGHGHACNPIRP